MNYSLISFQHHHPLTGREGSPHSRKVSYSASKGIYPKGFKKLEISLTSCEHPVNDLLTLLQALPNSTESLHIRLVDLNLVIDDIVSILSAIPNFISSLHLFIDEYNQAEDYVKIFKAIPESIQSCYIDWLSFKNFCAADLISILKSIHTKLNIELNIQMLLSYSNEDLVEALASVPANGLELRLSNNENLPSADDLIRVLTALPNSIDFVLRGDLWSSYNSTTNKVRYMPAADIILVLQAVPKSITDLTLFPGSYTFNHFSIPDRIKMLQAVPPHIVSMSTIYCRTINEGDHINPRPSLVNNASQITSAVSRLLIEDLGLKHLIAAIPAAAKELTLDLQEPYTVQHLLNLLSSIPSTVESLRLHIYHDALLLPMLASALQTLPSSVKWLRVVRNQNSNFIDIAKHRCVLFNSIPSSVREFNFNYNHDYNPMDNSFSTADRIEMLHALPKTHNRLRLFWERVAPRWDVWYDGIATTVNEIIPVIAAIPSFVFMLDLSEIGLFNLGTNGFKQVLQNIPPTITYLDLSENGLHKLTIDQLVEILACIPSGVTHLDLRGNLFHRTMGLDYMIGRDLSAADFERLLKAIPKHVTQLLFEVEDVITMELGGKFDSNREILINTDLDFAYDFVNECFVRKQCLYPKVTKFTRLLGLHGDGTHMTLAPYLNCTDINNASKAAKHGVIVQETADAENNDGHMHVNKKLKLST